MGALFDRRISRLPFWGIALANFGLIRLLQNFVPALSVREGTLSMVIPLLLAPAFLAAVWRLHDIGKSGTLAFLAFVANLASGLLAPLASELWRHNVDRYADEAIFLRPDNVVMLGLNLVTFWLIVLCLRPSVGGWAPREDIESDEAGMPETPSPVRPAPALRITTTVSPAPRGFTPSAAGRKSFGRRG